MARKLDGEGNGGTTKRDYAVSVGANGTPNVLRDAMLAGGQASSNPTFESGSEPTGVLLAMIWSAAETLIARGEAKLLASGKGGGVAILLPNANYDKERGLVERG